MNATRLLVLCGSSRAGSLNRKLAACAAEVARAAGADVGELDLRSLDLPVYDGDREASLGIPPGAQQLRGAIEASDAVLIVTPEYNGFPPPLLINAFDWMSRIAAADGAPAGLAATANKPAGLLAASPGAGGALRSMNFLRQYLQMAFAMIVVPQQFALGRAHEAFDDAGRLKEPRATQAVAGVVAALMALARAVQMAR